MWRHPGKTRFTRLRNDSGGLAVSGKDQKIFMLAQGFMPAQSIHIVKNLQDEKINLVYVSDSKNYYASMGVLQKSIKAMVVAITKLTPS